MLSLVGCITTDIGEEVEVGELEQPIIGGQSAPFDDAVVNLSIGCTGTLIRPNVVLTAAHCLPGGSVRFGPSLSEFFASRRIIDTFQSRRYGAGLFAGGDIALVRLESDAPAEVEPLPFNDILNLTSDDHTGAEVRTVGYGNTDGINDTGYGIRRQVTHSLLGVEPEFITTGTETANTCQGDSGGPTFMQIDGVERVIAVTSFGEGGCLGASRQTRVDAYVDEFIYEVLDAWSGPCARDGTCVESCPGFPDPDCGPCGLDNVCSTGCAKKDLDCPLSGDFGDTCADREECESLTCAAAYDDARVGICSTECDPGAPERNYDCPQPFSQCLEGEGGRFYCQYSGITPSAQGADCDAGDDCRSGMCDLERGGVCVESCGDGLPECGDGFGCEDIGGGQSACRLPKPGGCAVGGGGSGGLGVLIGLGMVLAAVRRRRR